MHQECFKFMIVLQANFAVTTRADLRAELLDVIEDLMPLELKAHNWRSAFYYRYKCLE